MARFRYSCSSLQISDGAIAAKKVAFMDGSSTKYHETVALTLAIGATRYGSFGS
jgi:hypothetical protein